ncbi:hypothetical protein [Nitrosovibrio sp. Nv4]|uniref:hypothetical protein n=1 Tax=Nitrosovibrio sp. Nv4 TaxID=1945880 RepID=UPI00117E90F4|nr:hypothetical protein [Nitrosovibrio sp. Nv4]
MNIPSGAAAGMAQDSPFVYPSAMHDQFARHGAAYNQHNGHQNKGASGRPLIVLPVPLQGNGMSGFNSMYGFQYPGSYMPRDTPLHRFNGYVVCDPPELPTEATTEPGAVARRSIKITSTRSLAAPAHSQPCPVYTINGEIPKQKSYTTKPSRRNAP